MRNLTHIQPGQDFEFLYKNHRNEVANRRVRFLSLMWGTNDWHPNICLMLEGLDLDKGAIRTFDVGRIAMGTFQRYYQQPSIASAEGEGL